MVIRTSREVVEEMVRLAILASKPVGMGIFHYDPQLKKEDIQFGPGSQIDTNPRGIFVDYYGGRMVKFQCWIRNAEQGDFEFNDHTFQDYQSWKTEYNDYQVLYEAARINIELAHNYNRG